MSIFDDIRGIFIGQPWYRVHTIVLNDPTHLLFVCIMHTTLVASWTGLMVPYALAVFDPSHPVLDPMWRHAWYVWYTLRDSFRNSPFVGWLEYHMWSYNEFGYLELRKCGRDTYCVFRLVLFGGYLALGLLGSTTSWL